ncbi:MAG: GAF domain-containing protein, partial [Candidatus Latescibacterota bacterium]
MAQANDIEGLLYREAIDLVLAPQPLAGGVRAVLGAIARLLGADCCAFYLLDQRTEDLVLLALAGDPRGVPSRQRVGQGITGLAAYQRRPIHVAHVQQDPRSRPAAGQPIPYKGVTAVPVQEAGQLVGVLTLHHREVQQPCQAELGVVQEVLPRLLLTTIRAAQTEECLRQRTS